MALLSSVFIESTTTNGRSWSQLRSLCSLDRNRLRWYGVSLWSGQWHSLV